MEIVLRWIETKLRIETVTRSCTFNDFKTAECTLCTQLIRPIDVNNILRHCRNISWQLGDIPDVWTWDGMFRQQSLKISSVHCQVYLNIPCSSVFLSVCCKTCAQGQSKKSNTKKRYLNNIQWFQSQFSVLKIISHINGLLLVMPQVWKNMFRGYWIQCLGRLGGSGHLHQEHHMH